MYSIVWHDQYKTQGMLVKDFIGLMEVINELEEADSIMIRKY